VSAAGARTVASGRDDVSGGGAGRCAGAGARCAAWIAWWLAGASSVALFWSAPAVLSAASPAACAFRQVTGVECPTCGLTRAFAALAQGAWRESLALHPWALALALQAVAAWVLWATWLAGGLRVRPDRWVPHAVAANLGALVMLWIARLLAHGLPG
jgi:hypothetical protein